MTPEQVHARYLSYLKPRAAQARKEGRCIACLAPCEPNPKTGKPYVRCAKHRAMAARVQQRLIQTRRARWLEAGLCRECGAPVFVDRLTQRPFKKCLVHLRAQAQYQKTYKETRR